MLDALPLPEFGACGRGLLSGSQAQISSALGPKGPLGHRAPCPGARRAGPRSRTPATDLVGEPLTRRGQTHPLGQVQLLLLLAGCCLPSCLLRCAKEWRKVGNSCSNLPQAWE